MKLSIICLWIGIVLSISSCKNSTNENANKAALQNESGTVERTKVLTAEDIYNQNIDKVAMIISYKDGIPYSQGSAFFIDQNTMVTNFHCVAGSERIEFKFAGNEEIYKGAKVVKVSDDYDLAIIKTKQDFPFVKVDYSGNEKVGSKIYAIGNPRGLEGSISDGILSGKRENEGIEYLQITAPINPGNSGGPVLNEKGNVVGVATFTFRNSQNLNFAMPIKYIDKCKDYDYTKVRESLKVTENNNAITLALYRKPRYEKEEFSIRNNTNDYIKNIESILIYKDQKGEVLNYRRLKKIEESLPPHMAKLFQGKFKNDEWIYYDGDWNVRFIGDVVYDVELRVLSYEIEE